MKDLIWIGNIAYFKTFRIERGIRHGREVYALGELKEGSFLFERIETLLKFLTV